MDKTINAKQLRADLPRVVERVRRGERFTVLYRSRPAFRVVPVEDVDLAAVPLEEDPLYGMAPVGSSADGHTSEDHDALLYR
ncbi:MAG: type II toxin-antitoxin system prevent-host-death family antitoxin [Polyangiaceae bacterium]